jgi:hypothetical protein
LVVIEHRERQSGAKCAQRRGCAIGGRDLTACLMVDDNKHGSPVDF